jgi:hypothetical protein
VFCKAGGTSEKSASRHTPTMHFKSSKRARRQLLIAAKAFGYDVSAPIHSRASVRLGQAACALIVNKLSDNTLQSFKSCLLKKI